MKNGQVTGIEVQMALTDVLDQLDWAEADQRPRIDNTPYATLQSSLTLFGVDMTVYTLSDGSRVFSEDDVRALFLGPGCGEVDA